MSNSLYKDMLQCEAAAMAKLTGEWSEEPSEAMLAGSYVHASLDGTLEEFRSEHPEMFLKNGIDLKAQFRTAEDMIRTLREDEFIQFVLTGQREHIITAEFAGCTWKAKLDVYNPDAGRIADVKTVRAIRDKTWIKDMGWGSFVEAYGYLRQMALYVELERIASGRETWLEPLIVAVSKEDPPDKQVIGMDTQRIEYELEQVKANMPRVLSVWTQGEEPIRCETCKYCRATKRLGSVMHYADLIAI